jgi:branched-chain amino acid transport system substrate-binding protein
MTCLASTSRRFAASVFACALVGMASAAAPVYVALDAEFGNKTSTVDDAIEAGIEIAIEEINAAGGVLGGRPLQLLARDNRGVPARGVDNFRELAAIPDLVAVIGGKFSPVLLAQLPLAHELKLPLISVWSAADPITLHDRNPSYSFRVSLRDGWTMPFLMQQAAGHGYRKLGLLVPNGAWGRSALAAAASHAQASKNVELAGTVVFEWADESLDEEYQRLLDAGSQAILLVANEPEAARLAKAMLARPRDQWRPIYSHCGAASGPLPALVGDDFFALDFVIVQTYSFLADRSPTAQRVARAATRRLGVDSPDRLPSPPGIAQGYDVIHLLAKAIDTAGSTDRERVRAALERLPAHDGLIRRYAPAFTAGRHDALGPEQLLLVRWQRDGSLRPLVKGETRGR